MALVLLAFERAVNFVHALPEQKEPAAQQDEVAAGERLAGELEQRIGERHHPSDRQEQADPRPRGERKTDRAGATAFALAQACDQNRNEDDVVDTEHDLERGERGERNPGARIRQPIHGTRLPMT